MQNAKLLRNGVPLREFTENLPQLRVFAVKGIEILQNICFGHIFKLRKKFIVVRCRLALGQPLFVFDDSIIQLPMCGRVLLLKIDVLFDVNLELFLFRAGV